MSTPQAEEQHLDKTIEALDHSLEKGTAAGSATSINYWIKALGEHKGFQTIVHDLEKLKTAIEDKDGKKIVTLLEKLGHETVKAADKADGDVNTKVKKIGDTLLKAAQVVGKLVG